jgi:hypothetical protein
MARVSSHAKMTSSPCRHPMPVSFYLRDDDRSEHSKFTCSFRAIIASGQVEPLPLPARSPNLNAFRERWVRSVKEECLSRVILFGERSLRRAASEYVEHYHAGEITGGRAISCCFLRRQNLVTNGLSMPRATGWATTFLPSSGCVSRRASLRRYR